MASNRKLKNRRRAEAERLQQRYNTVMTGMALFVLTIAPLVFRMVRIDFVSPAITNTTTADTGAMSDVFTHYKMLMYYVLSAVLVVMFSVKLLTVELNDFRLTRYDAALAALCAFLLLSCITSEYRHIAIHGFIYMLDGAAAHICYCILLFMGYHVFSRSRLVKWCLAPLAAAGLINACISLLNFAGVNMIDSAIIKTILGVPAGAVATNARAFTSTFGNVNYLSGFGGVFFAVFFTKLLYSPRVFRRAGAGSSTNTRSNIGSNTNTGANKNSVNKTGSNTNTDAKANSGARGLSAAIDRSALIQTSLSFLMVAAAFTIVVTSLSSSGFLTVVVMAPVIIAFAFLSGGIRKKAILSASALAICAIILFSLATIDDMVYEETFGMFGAFALNDNHAGDGATDGVGAGVTDASDASDASGAPYSKPGAGTPLPMALPAASTNTVAPVALVVQDAYGAPVALSAPVTLNAPAALNATDAHATPIALSALAAPVTPAATAESIDFDLPEYFPAPGISPGTGRLYIWGETLTLIMRKPITGYGMDTLSYTFPQNSLEKVAGLGAYEIFVTKPHNAFIAYAYGAGIPALLAFLLLNIFAAAAFLRYFLARRAAGEAPDLMIMCALLGWAAYLVQAFVNDDLISTTPLWWTLLGIGLGLLNSASTKDNSTRA